MWPSFHRANPVVGLCLAACLAGASAAQEFATEVSQGAAAPAPEPAARAGPPEPELPAVRVGGAGVRIDVAEAEGHLYGIERPIQVVGGEPYVRTVFNSYAGELRSRFRWAIHRYRPNERQSSRHAVLIPVRVEIWGRPSDIHEGTDSLLGIKLGPDDRPRIDVVVRLHDRFDEDLFRLQLVRALVFEQMLSPHAQRPEALLAGPIKAPEWIVHGFDELLEHRRIGRPSAFYAGMLRSGRILSPAELFATESPEGLAPVERSLFRATSAAMVGALLAQPEGDAALRGLLGDLALGPGRDPSALLRQHFPAFREMGQGMERWWALQVASLSQQQAFEFLGHEETDRWVEEALAVRFEAQEGAEAAEARPRGLLGRIGRVLPAPAAPDLPPFDGSIREHASFLGRPGAEEKLARCFDNLQHLRTAGHPLYRPVLERYEEAVLKLMRKQTRGMDEELAAIAALRGTVLDTLRRSEDYLNYFEATQAPRRSEAFEDYLRLKRELESSEAPARRDRIAEYLDFLEKEFR